MKEYPLNQIYFYLTEGCNLACRHCWLSPPVESEGPPRYEYLPPGLFRQIIDEAVPLGLKSVKLTGGEPFLHPGILTLLEILNARSIPAVIETNGVLFTFEILDLLKLNPKPFVSVSIDSPDAEFHDLFRGRKGSFRKSCDCVRSLAGAGISTQMILSLVPGNAGGIMEYMELATSLGAGSVKINIIQPTSRGQKLHEQSQVLQIKDILRIYNDIKADIQPRFEIPVFYDIPLAFRALSDIHAGFSGRCGIKHIIGVLPGGAYALCGIGAHIEGLVFGQAGTDTLPKIWLENEILLSIREHLPEKLEGICSRCCMKYLCLGSCLAQNVYRAGSIWKPYWFCDLADREGLFPPTRIKPVR